MEDVGLGDLYTAWLIFFTTIFGIRAFIRAGDSEQELATQLGWATAFAATAAALFTGAQWLAIQAATRFA